jgi:hypothetical protein
LVVPKCRYLIKNQGGLISQENEGLLYIAA